MTYERVVIECEDGGGVFDEDHDNERGGHGAFAPERKFDADGSLTRAPVARPRLDNSMSLSSFDVSSGDAWF